ncbi:hypothetical protein INQ51_11445 [Maribellus sp. CM-23]|uniref:hypothetical protein n=1 Tax=Maribellus sp. CM-23 TaxID=2781026 RepID=UPI001F2D356C|nr:hypothetical protein [Maribellus sp. CM-23]MCE4564924.1 hypothetical protein [Maribellus sp. CM-23]
MKFFLASILIFSILSFQLSELLVVAGFKLRQDYIAKNLCVEKDVEDSTCKGCCQLKKKLDEQQQQKEELPPVQTEKENIFVVREKQDALISYFPEKQDLTEAIACEYTRLISVKIFRPPQG